MALYKYGTTIHNIRCSLLQHMQSGLSLGHKSEPCKNLNRLICANSRHGWCIEGALSDSVPQQNTVQLDFVQPNAPIRDSRVQFAERCSSANYRNEFLIGAVRRTAPITMRDGQQPTGSGVLGGDMRVYGVYQPPVFLTAYTHLSDHK